MKQKKQLRRLVAVLLAATLALAMAVGLAACGRKTDDTLSVRYLNFKPESAEKYQALAKLYEEQTGVKIIVETAANNTYEQTLAAKMATDEAPTLFQINGPRGYAAWKDYCADLKNTQLYQHLTDKSLAVTDGDKVVGIPYVVEGYGIIYNTAITDKYFALADKATPYTSMDQVNSFEKLKAVVEDMQKNAAALGIEGVFASTSLKSGEDWRWQTHLLNLPLYYEFQQGKLDLTDPKATEKISFSYATQFKNIFDLYIENSLTDRKLLGSKTVVDSMSEFALERCAMVQNGNWAWSQIKDVSGNKVKEENLRFMPIYTGVEGEEGQGLAVGTENFYAINSKASEEQQKAAADFIYWLYSSKDGKRYVTQELGFIAPFDTFSEGETPNDPLAREIARWMAMDQITAVPWNFTLFPSARFKEDFGASLLKYAQGGKTWEDVVRDMVAGWERESSAATL
ncbi:MAG: carbohydrate ABC transporter substrate-binding protein [Clostridia bacterium]|nr:carbohydrate ABC transporter substrate-binding protein [Clostridia bacterium]